MLPVPWHEDFAEARNCVLTAAVCDWVLVLDWDEMLDETARSALPALLRDRSIWAYSVVFCNYVSELGHRCGGEQAVANPGTLEQARAFPVCFPTESTRLFRRDPRIRFAHCVHESVVDSLQAARLPAGRANFVIHHFGYTDDPLGKSGRKDDFYHRLALKKLESAPESFQAQLEVGMGEFDHLKRPAVAVSFFTAAIAIDPGRHIAWLYRGMSLGRMGRYAEALEDLTRAARLNANSPLVHSAMGDLYFQTSRYREASAEYGMARRLGDASPLSYAKLGAAEVQLGQTEQGLTKVKQAVAESPATAELLDILSTAALLAGQAELACAASSRRLSMNGVSDFHFVLAASIHLQASELARAKLILYVGSRLFPESQEIEQMRTAS